jgi:hypothetical protein
VQISIAVKRLLVWFLVNIILQGHLSLAVEVQEEVPAQTTGSGSAKYYYAGLGAEAGLSWVHKNAKPEPFQSMTILSRASDKPGHTAQ